MSDTNMHLPEDSQKTSKQSLLQMETYIEQKFEQKFEQMFTALQRSQHDITALMRNEIALLSQHVVKKQDLQQLLDQNNATVGTGNVEMDVVKESASYAKQLVQLLEEAAMSYVAEKESKDELRKQHATLKNELTVAQQHYSELESKYDSTKEQLKALEKKHENLIERYRTIRDENEKLRDNLNNLDKIQELFDFKIQRLEQQLDKYKGFQVDGEAVIIQPFSEKQRD